MDKPSEHIVDLRKARLHTHATKPKHAYELHPAQGIFASFISPNPTSEKKEKFEEKKRTKKRLVLTRTWVRPFITVVVCIFLIFVSVYGVFVYRSAMTQKGKVLGESLAAFEKLQTIQGDSLASGNDLQASLQEANEHFIAATESLTALKQSLGILQFAPIIRGNLTTANHLVSAGKSITEAATTVQSVIAELGDQPLGYTGFFASYTKKSPEIKMQLDLAYEHITAVDSQDVPKDFRDTFVAAKGDFLEAYESIGRMESLADTMSSLLGFSEPTSLLFAFQNNQELRPTGGFIGSVARVHLDKGVVTSVEVPKGGSYDISGQITQLVRAPKPLQLVNPYFSFQDANWFPDFPTSAKRFLQFYEAAGNKPVDGVIAFTPDVLISFLKLTGPITLNNQEVDSDSLLTFLRDSIESEKATDSHEPKKVIAELFPQILARSITLSSEDQWRMASLLDTALQQKDLLLFANSQEVQSHIVSLGASGELPAQTTNDFLAVVAANVAGGKTDRVISQHVNLQTQAQLNATENVITITRSHGGSSGDPILGTVNLSYVRMYIPKGSRVNSAEGWYDVPAHLYQIPPKETPEDPLISETEKSSSLLESYGLRVTEEFGYTCVGGWVRVGPGESVSVTVSYTLPTIMNSREWSIFVWRQPGLMNPGFTWELTGDKSTEVIMSSFANAAIDPESAKVSAELVTDGIFGVKYK